MTLNVEPVSADPSDITKTFPPTPSPRQAAARPSNLVQPDDYDIDRLIWVPAALAIGGESTHFTPWLASHIDVLVDCIRINLTVGTGDDQIKALDDMEVPVGEYFLDIRARTYDGRLVAIENQYGRSDHKHLGQVITYASGIEADLVIWIAEEFSEPHLEALRWLNRRTDKECGAFAVKIGFYRIGSSKPAPSLTCLVEPSNWIKESRKAEVAANHWTIPEFLDQMGDEADQSSVKVLLARLEATGGRYWCGRRGGNIHLHPLPDQSATLGLSLNTKGQVCVSGMWRHWKDTYGDPAYEDIASVLGLSFDGPASARVIAAYDPDVLWSAAMRSAEKLRDRELGDPE